MLFFRELDCKVDLQAQFWSNLYADLVALRRPSGMKASDIVCTFLGAKALKGVATPSGRSQRPAYS